MSAITERVNLFFSKISRYLYLVCNCKSRMTVISAAEVVKLLRRRNVGSERPELPIKNSPTVEVKTIIHASHATYDNSLLNTYLCS